MNSLEGTGSDIKVTNSPSSLDPQNHALPVILEGVRFSLERKASALPLVIRLLNFLHRLRVVRLSHSIRGPLVDEDGGDGGRTCEQDS